MKKFVFREARLLALRKQEVKLAEIGVAQASEQAAQARQVVASDLSAIDELAASITGGGTHGITLFSQIALGLRARLEVSRGLLAERERALSTALHSLRRTKIAMESLATLERSRKSDHRQSALKEVQAELDVYGARKWLMEGRHD